MMNTPLPGDKSNTKPKPYSLVILLAYLILSAGIVLKFRLFSIAYPFPLNPDEAQAAANAIRIWNFGVTWKDIDGTTVGPFNSLILAWPFLLKLGVTFTTVRITAYLLVFTQIAAIAISCTVRSNVWLAILATLPLVIFYAIARDTNLTHYSSELLSMTLCISAFSLLIICYSRCSFSPRAKASCLFISGVLISCVPFSKLQIVPLATLIGMMTLILIYLDQNEKRIKQLIIFVTGVIIVPLFMFTTMVFNGSINDFYTSYIVWSGVYVGQRLTLESFYNLLALNPLSLKSSLSLFSMAVISLGFMFWHRIQIKSATEKTLLLFSLLLVPLAVFVISWSGKKYIHYLLILVPIVSLFFSMAISNLQKLPTVSSLASHHLIIVGIWLFFVGPVALYNARDIASSTLMLYPFGKTYNFKSPKLFDWILPANSASMVAWGWDSANYVQSGMPSASRETHNFGQLKETKLQDYFRSRFIKDIKHSQPALIIDTVRQGAFVFNNPAQHGIETFPEFEQIVTSQYIDFSTSDDDNNCPHTYLRTIELEKFVQQNIKIKKATASAVHAKGPLYDSSKLNDFNVVEYFCNSYWLLPDNQTGHVEIELEKPSRLSEIQLLNTRNGKRNDRASHTLRIELIRNQKIVHSETLIARRYPYWTVITLDQPMKVDQLRIDIESFLGRGGGLNEVKLFNKNNP